MSDLYVRSDGDGPEITVDIHGNPTLTGGLDSAVYLGGFVGPWWANRITPAGDQYTSAVEAAMRDVLTLRTARNVEESIRSALQWLISDGVAQSIAIESEIASRERVNVAITITEPSRRRTTYRYGLNWAAQQVHTIEEGRR